MHMNRKEQRWLEDNPGKIQELNMVLQHGFELHEVRTGVVLVWGEDVTKLASLENTSRVNHGAIAYQKRQDGLKWREVGEEMGCNKWNACLVAKRYAKQKGLPWPPV